MAQAVPSGFKEKYGSLWFDGLPFEGEVTHLKKDDPAYRQPVEASRTRIRQLSSASPEDMKEWTGIMQKVADGVAKVSFEEKVYDPDVKGWRVLIRWVEYYYTNPEVLNG